MIDTVERGSVVLLALPFRFRRKIHCTRGYIRPEPGRPIALFIVARPQSWSSYHHQLAERPPVASPPRSARRGAVFANRCLGLTPSLPKPRQDRVRWCA
jgi:hypothetical protein